MWHDEDQGRGPFHGLDQVWYSHDILRQVDIGQVLPVNMCSIDDLGELLPLKLSGQHKSNFIFT